MSETTHFERLCDHYQDTYSGYLTTLDRRNRLFFFLLISVGLFTVNITATDFSVSVISQVVENSSGIALEGSSALFSSLLWLAVAGMAIRYFQLAVQIERQYDYIHALEAEISDHYSETSVAFTREGISYNNNYPTFSSWLHLVYTKAFPILLATIAIVNIHSDIFGTKWTVDTLVNLSCFLILEITIALYMIFQHRNAR